MIANVAEVIEAHLVEHFADWVENEDQMLLWTTDVVTVVMGGCSEHGDTEMPCVDLWISFNKQGEDWQPRAFRLYLPVDLLSDEGYVGEVLGHIANQVAFWESTRGMEDLDQVMQEIAESYRDR